MADRPEGPVTFTKTGMVSLKQLKEQDGLDAHALPTGPGAPPSPWLTMGTSEDESN